MNSQCAAISFCENLKIAASLRGFYDPECVFLLRYGNIGSVIAVIWRNTPVLGLPYKLPSGMLETRTDSAQVATRFLHEWTNDCSAD